MESRALIRQYLGQSDHKRAKSTIYVCDGNARTENKEILPSYAPFSADGTIRYKHTGM